MILHMPFRQAKRRVSYVRVATSELTYSVEIFNVINVNDLAYHLFSIRKDEINAVAMGFIYIYK